MSSVTHSSLETLPTRVEAAAKEATHQRMLPLDGVRGTAILLVLYAHMAESFTGEFAFANPFWKAGLLGWAGVDLFFVLSGFLITGILYDAKDKSHFFKNFYARRALRIFPLYYLALIVVFLASKAWPSLGIWGTENPAWMWGYMTNILLGLKGADIFGVLDHFWSLAVEEHYYLVWPSVVFLLGRRKLMYVAAGAMVLAFLLRLSVTDAQTGMSMAGYAFTPMRMDALAAGSFIALAARGPGGLEKLFKPAAFAAPLAFLAFFGLAAWRRTPSPEDPFLGTIGLTLLWIAFGSMLILSLTWRPLSTVMVLSPLRWFGKYAYGLYVWHPIFIIALLHTDWARELRGGDTPLHAAAAMTIALALSFGMALLSWKLWEKQFLKLKTRFE